ncbi:MAG: AbrB/MazE/SpoVT family DNA-binding domain-containing protein [Pseudomonadota bacterium]|nr:AbrB/MazE/SpoVT family DNA-binding domain-containing protein [Pseudomonadota bacterium]
MTTEYRAKTFRSGNSLALRLPKGLGLTEGLEMIVREEQGRYIVEPLDAPRKTIDLTGISGLYPLLRPLPRDEFGDSPRAWQMHSSSASDGH